MFSARSAILKRVAQSDREGSTQTNHVAAICEQLPGHSFPDICDRSGWIETQAVGLSVDKLVRLRVRNANMSAYRAYLAYLESRMKSSYRHRGSRNQRPGRGGRFTGAEKYPEFPRRRGGASTRYGSSCLSHLNKVPWSCLPSAEVSGHWRWRANW
jgi:hypothetical protein